MKASTSTSSKSKQRPQYVCTHLTCKNKKGHTVDRCYTRARELAKRADDLEAKKKGKGMANIVEEASSDAKAANFAGNASAFDLTYPCSPLVIDAGADWNADTGATSHMTPHRH